MNLSLKCAKLITGSGFLKGNNWRSSWGHYVLNLSLLEHYARKKAIIDSNGENCQHFWPPTFGWKYIPEFKLWTTQGMLQDQFLMQGNLRKSIVLAQIIHSKRTFKGEPKWLASSDSISEKHWFGEKYFFIFEKKFKKSTCCWYSLLHQWRYNYGIFQDAQAQ